MAEPSESPAAASPAGQLQILDYFFPGFSMIAGIVQKYLHVDLNLYIPLLMLSGIMTVCWNYASSYIWDHLESHFMSVVDIRTDDEIYNILMAWVAAQKFAQGARRFVVNTNLSRSWNLWRWDEDEDEEEYDGSDEAAARRKKKALSYTPSFGSHYFFYRGRLLLFRRTANREQNSFLQTSEKEEISISCFGRNPWILKELLMDARQKYLDKDEHKTQIYRGTTRSMSTEPVWQRCMSRASRPFSTVILNEKVKNELIADVTDYLKPATQRWYANRGIPYRRGYLLYGPPGTGKSSLSLALAGFFRMRIYMVSLSGINANEETLGNLFAELPRRCVVLLEDIDTAGLTHTREEKGANAADSNEDDDMEPGQVTRGNGNTNNNNNPPSNRLSLSGLLNILDGVASQEGRILIMTTNHLEKLDKALIRPGRVDLTVEFGLADNYMSRNIYRNIYASYLDGKDDDLEPQQLIRLTPEEREAIKDAKAKEQAAHDAKIDILAEKFASRIPEHEFSPAELQGHLLKFKHSPDQAIEEAETFIEKTRKDRKEKEVKAAEEKRRAEKEKAENDKKKAEEDKKKSNEKKIRERVEKEIRDKYAQEIKTKVDEELKASESKRSNSEKATPEMKKDTPAPDPALVTESSSVTVTAEEKDEKGHSRQDSGYTTESSDKA